MTKSEFQDLLAKYLDGKCNAEEEKLLIKFYDSFQEETTWPEKLGVKETFESHLLADINKHINSAEKSQSNKRFRMSPAFMIAASIILILSIGSFLTFLISDQNVNQIAIIEKNTQKGQKSTLVLSDGTQIRLNSGSQLVFPEKFEGNVREVVLIGEAFFDVAKDASKPFIIKTGELTTTVLGTSFNIKAFPEENIEVTVATGKVKVERYYNNRRASTNGEKPDSSKLILTPNQQVNYDLSSGTLEKREVDIKQYLSWKDGILSFDEMELQEACKILERWYGVSISFSNEAISHCKIQRSTYKNENLLNILQSFQFFLGIEFEVVEGNQITLKGNGCGDRMI